MRITMRVVWVLMLWAVGQAALGQACVVHSTADRLDVKVCQQNRNIPQGLFRDGFCQPNLPGQKVSVSFADQCPAGAFGVCSQAHVDNMPYQQDIHYYGVASDARFLKPFCEQKSSGVWITPR